MGENCSGKDKNVAAAVTRRTKPQTFPEFRLVTSAATTFHLPLYETVFSGEIRRVNIRLCLATGVAVWFASAATVFAGGSGLNVVVVVNQNSTNSVQLGNYYSEKRGVPPQNFLRITNHWTGSNVWWTRAEFETNLLNPLVAMLTARHLTNQVDYIVLSMDFPYQVTATKRPQFDHSRVVLRVQAG